MSKTQAAPIDPLVAYADDPRGGTVHHPFAAYSQGSDAAEAGHSLRDNPYPAGWIHDAWSNGWMDTAEGPPSWLGEWLAHCQECWYGLKERGLR